MHYKATSQRVLDVATDISTDVALFVCLCVLRECELGVNGPTDRDAVRGVESRGTRNRLLDEDPDFFREVVMGAYLGMPGRARSRYAQCYSQWGSMCDAASRYQYRSSWF